MNGKIKNQHAVSDGKTTTQSGVKIVSHFLLTSEKLIGAYKLISSFVSKLSTLKGRNEI